MSIEQLLEFLGVAITGGVFTKLLDYFFFRKKHSLEAEKSAYDLYKGTITDMKTMSDEFHKLRDTNLHQEAEIRELRAAVEELKGQVSALMIENETLRTHQPHEK